jgi:uncharacterized membrane protein
MFCRVFCVISRQSVNFKRQAKEIRRSYWAKNMKLMVLCGFIVLVVVYIAAVSVCGFPLFKTCREGK